MTDDPFVFFIKGIHRPPGERDARLQFARVSGQAGVLPRPSRHDVLAGANAVPGREPEIGVLGGMLGAFKDASNTDILTQVRRCLRSRTNSCKSDKTSLRDQTIGGLSLSL